MKKRAVKRTAVIVSLLLIIGLCMTAALYRAAGCFEVYDDSAVAAQLMVFSDGSVCEPLSEPEPEAAPTEKRRAVQRPADKPLADQKTSPTVPLQKPSQAPRTGDTYPVVEINSSSGNLSYENIAFDNTTPYDPDIGALLSARLPFALEDNRTVQVLIYHTHTCESYLDEDCGWYSEDYYPRSTDGSQGVIAVGDRIAAALKAQGIGVVHDKTLHDYPSYEGSYARSWDTIEAYQKKYPGIVVTLDIHRDAMTADDGTKYKPTFTCDGRKAAQIMIMSGYDENGDFPTWDENLIFATKLQKECEDRYPGMTRPLYFGEFSYNMDFNNGSLLIEVGTDANTVDEASYTGELLGNALSSVLQKG